MNSQKRPNFLDLLKEIDRELNADRDLSTLTINSRHSIWWRCANNHVYRASIFSRARSNGCKECNKVDKWAEVIKKHQQSGKWTRLIDKASQEIIDLWDKELNKISIEAVSAGSHKKHKWRCGKGHIWEASPKSLIRGTRCPECARMGIAERIRTASVKRSGSLYDERPDLREQWDPTNEIDMREVSVSSNTRVKWICKYGHKWEAIIGNRTGRGSGCPYCINQTSKLEIYLLVQLRSVFKDVGWREKIDGKEVDILLKNEHIGVEVDGEYWHRNKFGSDSAKDQHLKSLYNLTIIRVRPIELPMIGLHSVFYDRKDSDQSICLKLFEHLETILPNQHSVRDYVSLGAANNLEDYREMISRLPAPVDGSSLYDLREDLAEEWDYDRNKPLTPDLFSPFSDQKVFWKCSNGHIYAATIKNRTNRGSGCPSCYQESLPDAANSRALAKIGSIEKNNPALVSYWDREENNGLRPNEVPNNINRTFVWRCKNGHRFTRLLKTMKSNQDCPVCTSILIINPELSNEWDFAKNVDITPEKIQAGSGKRVWWKCKNGHSWECSVVARTRDGKDCPVCRSIGFLYPNLLKEWDHQRNALIDPFNLSWGSSAKVWWICENNHAWETSVSSRTGRGSGCPVCARSSRAEAVRLNKLKKSGSLNEKYPEIAGHWHPILNGGVQPSDFSPNSHKLFWWVCDCGAEYQRTPNDAVTIWKRRKKYTCADCAN
jgi:hypothetical protein